MLVQLSHASPNTCLGLWGANPRLSLVELVEEKMQGRTKTYLMRVTIDGEEMGRPLNQTTRADYMKMSGYKSMAVGKWHLGIAERYHPLERGFDEFYGFLGGGRHYFPDAGNYSGREKSIRKNHIKQADFEYTTDAFTDAALDFMERQDEHPFFVYLAYNAVHTPLEAKEDDLADYKNLGNKDHQTLAAMTQSLDENIGRLLHFLEEKNIRKNTLIFFINDNGGAVHVMPANNYPLSGCKGTHYEGGIRVPFIVSWPALLPASQEYDHPVISFDILATMLGVTGIKSIKGQSLDGVNLVPYLTGENKERPHQTLFWREEVIAAVRDGDWKLLRFPDKPAALYNLADDLGELNNLASQKPELVQSLYAKLWAWEQELARPLWFLKTKYDKQVIDLGEEFHRKTQND
jgi:arylsulfatase A-like enzyme